MAESDTHSSTTDEETKDISTCPVCGDDINHIYDDISEYTGESIEAGKVCLIDTNQHGVRSIIHFPEEIEPVSEQSID